MKRDEMLWNCDRHSVKPVTLGKYVAEYMNRCENGWSNFSASFRVVALKLIQLIQFALQNKLFSPLSYLPLHRELSSTSLSLYTLDTIAIRYGNAPTRAPPRPCACVVTRIDCHSATRSVNECCWLTSLAIL